MLGYINGIDFVNQEAMKYYAPPNTWSIEKRKDLTTSRIFSGDWIGSRKMDGYFTRFVKDEDGNMFLLSRTKGKDGTYPNKIEWVPQFEDFFNSIPNGTCILGELYFPKNEGSKNVTSIMGCLKEKRIKRQIEGEYLHWYPFDIIAYRGQNLMNLPISERIQYLDIVYTYAYESDSGDYVDAAIYFEGEKLWEMLQVILTNGGEGIVITHKDCKYQPGKRPSKETLKCKKELTDTIDCFIMGANPPTKQYAGKEIESWPYWYNYHINEFVEGTLYKDYVNGSPIEPVTKHYFHNWAGSLKLGVMKDGQPCQIGNLSGLTEEILENWRDYVGQVCEVAGMEVFKDEQGNFSGIRHPKFIGWREDKSKEECLWENL